MAQKEFGSPAPDSPESAARDLRTGCQAVRERSQALGLIAAEILALAEWAEAGNRILPSSCMEQLRPVSSGAEHLVFFDESGHQAIKLTHPGEFGHSVYGPGIKALPSQYFDRLHYQNIIFGDDINIHGLMHDGEGHVQIVTSQPWISANEERPNPTAEEIEAFFKEHSFEPVLLNPDAPLFYSKALGLLVADAHDQNVLRDGQGNLVPIDVVTGFPGPDLLRKILVYTGDPPSPPHPAPLES